MYQPGDSTRGVVSDAYRIVSGCSATGSTLPPKNRRARSSSGAAMSAMTTCVSSWFINRVKRSLAVRVSNVVDRGDSSRISEFLGTALADALP